jgi:lysophosphatidic acid acyltransferase / lysophosphatidylinositol acyltransferase
VNFCIEAPWIVFHIHGSHVVVHSKPEILEKLKEKKLFILYNHVYDLDWVIQFIVLEYLGILGSVKIFLKDSVKYVATVGTMLYLSRQIFLKRNFEKDQKIVEKAMKDIAKLPENYSILLAPEGKRYTSENFKESVEFAKTKNIEPFKYHLMPRVKGFKTCASIIKENSEKFSVINLEIAYEHKTNIAPNIANHARGYLPSSNVHVYIDIIPMEKFESTDECLYEIYREKDKLQENFLKTKKFGDEKLIVKTKLERNLYTKVSTYFWIILTGVTVFSVYT